MLTVSKYAFAIKNLLLNILVYTILTGIAFVIIAPLIGIVSKTFSSTTDVMNPLVYLVPRNPTMDNINNAIRYTNYTTALPFTIFFSGALMILQVFICSLVGYGFARFNFPGREIIFFGVVLTIVIPFQTLLVPIYLQFRHFDFFGLFTLLGLEPLNFASSWVPVTMLTATGQGIRSGLYIFLFRQFFRGIPKEINEAATIDGAGTFYTYLRVMLPNAAPPIITVMLFSFVWQYNDTSLASIFMSRGGNLISIMLSTLTQNYGMSLSVWNPSTIILVVNAGVLICIAPLVVIYLLIQRYFIEGIETSGIVG